MNSEKSSLPKLPNQIGDDIVISGIAGRFPESDNMNELHDNLLEKRDMITADDRRWKLEHPRIPKHSGKISNLEKFDAVFFGIHSKQAHAVDPMSRMLLEHAYEAIVDAGVNPKQLRGTKTGVFIGAGHSESEKTWLYKEQDDGLGIIGHIRALYANRISYWLGVHGPSFAMDTGCSASFSALEQAYKSIKDGYCDAAIVGAANLCLDPYIVKQIFSLGALSPDGRCKTWDQSANGYVRSEAVCAVFIQKAKDAKRIYATIVHSKVNCDGYKEQGISYPSKDMQRVLLSELYTESGVSPTSVRYLEAHGTGTKVGDPEEIAAIDAVLGQNRSKEAPLLMGSVKSNLGHTEPVSGLVSLAKVILAMETGVIPPNLHFKECKQELKAILEGRLKVIDEATPWEGEYAAVNNFGFGGVNAHALLRINPKEKVNNGAPDDDLSRLVVVSGRTEDAVDAMLSDLESKPVDVEQLALLYNVHSDEINGHLYRGYTILPSRGIAKSHTREITSISGAKRPVWFVFPGIGSQWPGMGEDLLRIPIFSEAIRKCDSVLRPHGIDMFRVLAEHNQSIFDNILNCFTGIAAVQIGLVDVLRSLKIEPDYIIGHSVGELGCAYADGCLTAEQVIMAAYYRGLVSIQTQFIDGSMAAVGLGYKEMIKLCPPDIQVGCHNSSSSSTISGPADSVKKFVAVLKAKNIFAKEVACGNIPYHSSYIAAAGPKLLENLKKVLPDPKLRSNKWASTSIEMDKWHTEMALHSSAEYYTNNLLSPVLFEETSALIPKDAITIEIAPHGLLQAILKRSLPSSVTNIPLTQRDSKDNFGVLLKAIGKMFNAGLHPQINNLYPEVSFPVSRGTPMISPMIKWEHKEDWFVSHFKNEQNLGSGERVVKINTKNPNYESITENVINGEVYLPVTCYLTLIWETFATMKGQEYTKLPVVFEDIKFLSSKTIPKEEEIDLTLMVQKGTGRFEVVQGDLAIVTGMVRLPLNSEVGHTRQLFNQNKNNEEDFIASRDVYKEFRLRGYQYTGKFCSISRATATGSKAHIIWHDNWMIFMDNMLQMTLLGHDTRELLLPTSIKKILIDPIFHHEQLIDGQSEQIEFQTRYDKFYNVVSSGGVQIIGLQTLPVTRKQFVNEPVNEEHKFIPFTDGADMNLCDIARLVTNIVIENYTGIKVKTVELLDGNSETCYSYDKLLSPCIAGSLIDMILVQADVSILCKRDALRSHAIPDNISVVDMEEANKDRSAMLVIGHRLLADDRDNHLNSALCELKSQGFLLTRESETTNIKNVADRKGFHVILVKRSGKEIFVLLRKKEKIGGNVLTIEVNNNDFDWVKFMRKTISEELRKKSDARIIFIGQDSFDNGLLGLVNCLRREPGGEMIRGILIQDPTAPSFSLENRLYSQQLEKDLAVCVLRENGLWGTYNHFPLQLNQDKLAYHSFVKQNICGDLTSLTWTEGPLQPSCNNENLVEISYASLNLRDIMLANGKLSLMSEVVGTRQNQDIIFGLEYSGIDTSGKRVMGMVDSGAIASICISDPGLSWEVPVNWSLEDAATVPYVYATCCYALFFKGNMKKGDKVLIHAGTGDVGQAAINLALAEGCEVFTTVETLENRQFIKETFPQIRDDHIGNSSDTSFEYMIKEQTNGYGVDIVLNCLSGEKLLASVNCVAPGERFLETERLDLSATNSLGVECFMREINFHGVMLNNVFTASEQKKLDIKLLFDKYLKSGAIKPISRTVFSKDNIESAFRCMSDRKHLGKVMIKMQNENLSNPMALSVPQYYCLENRSYLILGGSGGFGLELCDWLVRRGARNLVITSRTGLRNGYQKMRVDLWRRHGVNVISVSGKDASVYEDCQYIIDAAAKLAPIDGIFNLAAVLKDALWENQTPENFRESFIPKAWATKNLDLVSRKSCPQLRHFVVFSSVTCGRGNPGQSNYGMSNSVMERICEKRFADGLPALAVQWGAVGDVGIVADMQEVNKDIVINGTLPQSIFSCLNQLNKFLLQSHPIVSSMVIAEKKSAVGSLSILDTVLNIMCLKDTKGINLHASLPELGMDSIMAVDIRQTLEGEFDVLLSAQDIRNLTLAKLQEMSNTKDSNETGKKDATATNEDMQR